MVSIGDPVVFRGDKYRVVRRVPDGFVLLKQRFSRKSALVKPEDLTWDDRVGVWRYHGKRH